MIYLLAVLMAASPEAFNPETDPAAGFQGVFEFGSPSLVSSEEGNYFQFPTTAIRFVPGEYVRAATSIYIPVPPGSSPRLRYSAVHSVLPEPLFDQARTPLVRGGGLDAFEIAAEPLPANTEHAVLEGVIPVAGTEVAVITLYPLSEEAPSSYASRISVRLAWDPPASRGIPVERDPLLSMIAPDGCLYWERRQDPESRQSVFWGKPWARIAIDETAGYTISSGDLEEAGCQVLGVPCSSFRMFTGPGVMFQSDPNAEHQLSEVSIEVIDVDEDGIFDDGDSVRFFGRGLSRWEYLNDTVERLQHRWASHNIYWLTWGGEDGVRFEDIPAGPDQSPQWGSTMTADIWLREQHIWMPRYETSTGWVWQTVSSGGSVQVPFNIPGDGPSNLEIAVVTDGSQSQQLTAYINGDQVISENWYGSGERILRADSLPIFGACNLELTYESSEGDAELSLVSVHVEYPDEPSDLTGRRLFPARQATGRFNFGVEGVPGCTVYDISDCNRPLLFTGTEQSGGELQFSYSVDSASCLAFMGSGSWMKPDSLVSASPGRLVGTVTDGDMLIVVNPFLLSGIWGIESLSSERGSLPVIASTSEIYNEFGQGVADPGAIRSAVRWAMDSWASSLESVVLTGDGHYDYMGFTTTQPVMIPPWIDLGTTRTCSDDRYVMAHDGAVLPEVPISRIPADNLSELGAFSSKLLIYSAGESSGEWMNRALLVADDEWGQQNWHETEHTVDCERIAEEVIPRRIDREKFYMVEYPWPPGPWTPDGQHPEKPEAREDFLETLNMGHQFFLYQGHGAADQIAHEVLMLGEDVSSLNNGNRLPVSFWATCDVGHFDNPGGDAIGETLVLHPAGGCIASVAATRGTYGSANYAYFRSVVDSLCRNEELSLGDAVWQSKLVNQGSYSNNNKFYVLFGYPDLPLPFPENGGSAVIAGDTLRSGEMNTFSGSGFIQDGLALLEVMESSSNTVYTGLGGSQIPYLQYGGPAYIGSQIVAGGEFSVDFFMPAQAVTGDYARARAVTMSADRTMSEAADPQILVEGTSSGGDLQGPEVEMWIRGYRGVQEPQLSGTVTLEAEISDSSGVCLLGGPGRELNLFVDGTGNNVSSYFTYHRGSAVSGKLEYTIESLAQGEHTLILQSVDGLGNSSRDTLQLSITASQDLSISQHLIYPNPGDGRRCFSFRISEDSQVTVSIFTVAGTRVQEISSYCSQGYNQIIWNGLDRDGDPLASGPYIYKIKAEALGTSSVFSRIAEEVGIVAVTREE